MNRQILNQWNLKKKYDPKDKIFLSLMLGHELIWRIESYAMTNQWNVNEVNNNNNFRSAVSNFW